jgi:hypothetical protein
MIELKDDALEFSFPGVHPQAGLRISFQRTLRIPDDGRDYPLPPGLGEFPLRHVDDYHDRLPKIWIEHGGVMLPMYQAEAMWLSFDADSVEGRDVEYPFAVKVATGKIDAVTGKGWSNGLHRRPQDYLVAPEQPWLDGYCVEEGVIRQFVAMPLGAGYSAEEQLTGKAEHGGLQLIVCPMKREVFERRFPIEKETPHIVMEDVCYSMDSPSDMGLAPGGRMKQHIYRDPYSLSDWDTAHASRCFVHIANSMVWRSITGEDPPTVPFTAADYTRHGLPWFEYYDEKAVALAGSAALAGMKSVAQLGKEKGDVPLPENESVSPTHVVRLRKWLGKDQVREGSF